jgi:hypothetical protein
MVPPLEESEDGNRASFPRWGKRSVISHHFTELVLRTTEMRMLLKQNACFTLLGKPGRLCRASS